ncbi:zinc finger protein [Phanerochaete sordida]|uniref:Zinc finger protein n=1 Tax=Phanerochaete sordida TaxID=48140 RepID=A0A9P3LKH1_9APHY|nr:zinc finger protein [Phanerochaete sordida]
MAAKVSLPSINEMFPEHMLGPWYADRDRPTNDQAHEPQQALRHPESSYAPHPSMSPETSYDATGPRLSEQSSPRARPTFRVQIPPTSPYESSAYTPSSSYPPSSATSAYPPSTLYTPSASSSTLPSYAPSPATFRAAPLPPSPYALPPGEPFSPTYPPQTQPYPAQSYANPLQQPYGAAAHYAMGAVAAAAGAASEEKKHSCPHCHKRFNRPSSLSIHVNTHTGAKPFRCPFPGCSRAFNVNSNMRRHWRNHVSAARRAGGVGPGMPLPTGAPLAEADPAHGAPTHVPSAGTSAQPALYPQAEPAPAAPGPSHLRADFAPEYAAPAARAPYDTPRSEAPPRYLRAHTDLHAARDRPPTPPLSHSASSSPQSSSGHSLPPVAPPAAHPPPYASYAPYTYAPKESAASYVPYATRAPYTARSPYDPPQPLSRSPYEQAHPLPAGRRETEDVRAEYARAYAADEGRAEYSPDAVRTGYSPDAARAGYSPDALRAEYDRRYAASGAAPYRAYNDDEREYDESGEEPEEDELEDEDADADEPPPSPPPREAGADSQYDDRLADERYGDGRSGERYGRMRSRSSPRLAPGRYAPYSRTAHDEWARPEGRARSSTVAGAGAGERRW